MIAIGQLLTGVVLSCAFSAGAELPTGEWHLTDIRGIESRPPACLRIWLEERSYSLVERTKGRFAGTYRNVVRGVPVGPTSFHQNCTWPEPARNPVASQFRLWEVAGKLSEGQWQLRAEQAMSGGDLKTERFEPFSTTLSIHRGSLLDQDGSSTLVFRKRAGLPPAVQQTLLATIERIHDGGCLEVMRAVGHPQDRAVNLCELHKQIKDLAGRYVSTSVEMMTEFDRVPNLFPYASKGMTQQRGVFIEFTVTYERQRIPGNALVYEEENEWHVRHLWL